MLLKKLTAMFAELKAKRQEQGWDRWIAELEKREAEAGNIEELTSLLALTNASHVEWYLQHPNELEMGPERQEQLERFVEAGQKALQATKAHRFEEAAGFLEAAGQHFHWHPQDLRFAEVIARLEHRIQLHNGIAETVENVLQAGDPTFCRLYNLRKHCWRQRGVSERDAEAMAKGYLARELLTRIWCAAHGQRWVPTDPLDPVAQSVDMEYADLKPGETPV